MNQVSVVNVMCGQNLQKIIQKAQKVSASLAGPLTGALHFVRVTKLGFASDRKDEEVVSEKAKTQKAEKVIASSAGLLTGALRFVRVSKLGFASDQKGEEKN